MWNLKKKKPSKQTNRETNSQIQKTHLQLLEGQGTGELEYWMKGVNCMVMNCNETFGGSHFVVHANVEL